MAPIVSNNTHRVRINYSTNSKKYKSVIRVVSLESAASCVSYWGDFWAIVLARHTDASVKPSFSVDSYDICAKGSDIFLSSGVQPVCNTVSSEGTLYPGHDLTLWTLPYTTSRGRTAVTTMRGGGVSVGRQLSSHDDMRISLSELGTQDAADCQTLLTSLQPLLCGIDGRYIYFKPYINIRQSARGVAKLRR